MPKLTTGFITLTDTSDIFSIRLSEDMYILPCNWQGKFDSTQREFVAYIDSTSCQSADTSKWEFFLESESNCTASFNDSYYSGTSENRKQLSGSRISNGEIKFTVNFSQINPTDIEKNKPGEASVSIRARIPESITDLVKTCRIKKQIAATPAIQILTTLNSFSVVTNSDGLTFDGQVFNSNINATQGNSLLGIEYIKSESSIPEWINVAYNSTEKKFTFTISEDESIGVTGEIKLKVKIIDYFGNETKQDIVYTWSKTASGSDGSDATQYYYHTVYCNDTTNGSGYTTTSPNSCVYMGTYYDTTTTDASTFTDATSKGVKWQYTKGNTGASGTSYWRNQGWIDLTSSEYAEDTWYPVVGSELSTNGTCRIKVSVQLNSGTKPSWSTHASGFSVDLEVEDQRSGWGTTDAYCLKYIDTFKYCSVSPASYTQLTYRSIPVLFLRGGGKYYVSTDFVCTWTRYTTTYTWQSESGTHVQTASPQNSRPEPRGTDVKGAKGDKGDTGNGIASITYEYATSQTQTGTKTTYQDSIPTLSATNKYLWQKETISYTNGTSKVTEALIGTYGDKGSTGAAAKSFMLISSSEVFLRDLRASGNQPAIAISTQVSGYSGTPSVSASNGTLSNGSLTVPYANTFDSITITATLSGAPTQTLVLKVLDKTVYGKYFGPGTSDPTGTVLAGDHYFNLSSKKIRYRTASAWTDLENADVTDQKEYATILSNAMADALGSVEEGSVISSYYAYFQTIIANQIKATEITVDAANINGKISIADVDGGGLSLTKDGIGATSADGKNSWQINADGSATFKNASIEGNLEAKKVTHDALKTIDAITGRSIGSSSMPSVTSKTLWNLDTVISGLRSGFLSRGHNYSGATINGVAVKHAVITTNGSSASVSSPSSGTALVMGTTYSGSATINAGDNKAVVNRLYNRYSFPVWVRATVSLSGNLNTITVRVYNASGSMIEYPTDANVNVILMPGESISIQGKSTAWWGSRTGYGTITCNISNGYAETKPAVLAFENRTFGGEEATEQSQSKYISVGTLSFTIPSRYLAVSYEGECSGLYRKVGSSYVALSVKSSSQFTNIYDLGSEVSSVELYYLSSVITTSYTKGEGEEEETYVSYDYSSIRIGRFAWTAFRSLGTEPLVIYDSSNREYRFSSNGYSGLHRSDMISSLFGYSATPTMYAGRNAYDAFISALGVRTGTYSLDLASKITINGSTLSSLTYMTVGADRITFENSSGSITFYTTGDTASELKSAYSAINAYVVLMASTLGIETTDIRPKANNQYSVGAEGNVYARGYFNTVNATVVNGGTVNGAVFN